METGQIHSLMSKVMKEVTHIGKDRKNPQQGYNFRGIDDVYNTLHGVLSANGVYFVPEVLEHAAIEGQTKSGTATINRTVKVRFTFYAPDGSSVQATTLGEGTDMSDKAANKAQSAAVKYCLIQVFCIPTQEMIDSEDDTPERGQDARQVDAERFFITVDEAFDSRETDAQVGDPDFRFTPGDRKSICKGVAKKRSVESVADLPAQARGEFIRAIVDGKFDGLRAAAKQRETAGVT